MRRIRETLRLHLQAGLSYAQVARTLKISKSAVGKYVLLARVAGVDCQAAEALNDEELEARLYRPALMIESLGSIRTNAATPGTICLWSTFDFTITTAARLLGLAPSLSAKAKVNGSGSLSAVGTLQE